MKNLSFAILLIFVGLYAINEFRAVPTPDEPIRNRLEEKHEPGDAFFIQRAYPDGKFHLKAYTEGLRQAKVTAQNRTATGFDEPWITQGPGNIGARVNTVVINPENEQIMYAGFSTGGVFKTEDGGQSWNPVFDDQLFLSIGDIALDPNDPDIVYVGTGDVNVTGFPFIGDGLYRSMDGGATWEHLGLTDQRIISKIEIDPTNSDVLFVGCMGLPFERNTDRGLYKSTDGGLSWEQSLFLSDSTGVTDVILNPENPQVLYATGWDRIRNNTESIVYGEGARVYKSSDGGTSWTMLEGGLPNATHSRLGITMSGTNPDVLFVEYTNTSYNLEGIYKTTDGGINWSPIPTDEATGLSSSALGGFGWYFGKIRVNPVDDNDIFLLGVDLWRTQNGGQSWEEATPPWWEYDVHADKHDLVFTPSGDILLGTDGGLYKTDITTTLWDDIENIPTTQFYRTAYNPHAPDVYYGGAQDNGTCGGNAPGINEWERIYGGDGFTTVFDPVDPNRFFVETQNGVISVTLNGGDFSYAGDGIDNGDRKNWDMPYIMSPHNRLELYAGTHRVYKGEGENPLWFPISDDLTDGTEEEHRYHNISTLDESRLVAGLLYVGTGDGNVWRKADDEDWTAISAGLPDQYVTDVQASTENPDVVFVSHSGYRDNDNIPHIHRSDDGGASWVDISGNLPQLAVNEMLILPGHADSIIFAATDGGVYGSVNGGMEWERVGNNMPIIPVYDLVHNEANNELVAGTFGRSIMIYPLEFEVDTSVEAPGEKPVFASKIKCAPNPAVDMINISLQNIEPGKKMELVILDANGRIVHQFTETGMELNRDIAVSGWASGTYIVKVKMRHQLFSEQIVVL